MSELSRLSDLYEATRVVGLSDSLDELVDDVLERAQQLIGFEHCALMLFDDDAEELTVRRARGYGDRRDQVLGLTLGLGEGLSGWAAEHREAVRVGNVRDDPRYVAGLREARSNLAVPLVVGNEVAGVINVESERRDAFTEGHEMLLTVLGAQAALAILASRARARLEDRLRHLDALYRVSRLASEQRDLEGTLDRILTIAQEIVPEGEVAILLRDGDRLRVEAASGYREGVKDLEIPMGEGITGRCAAEAETVVIEDVDEHPDYIPGVRGSRSEIAVPLKVEGDVIGVLNTEVTRPHAFGPEEERTLSVVAQQVAAVLHTIRLHQETRELAITDPLTGLPNRRHFISQLEEHVLRAERYDERLSLLLLDCDQLKDINDRFGHHYGDRALAAVAEALRDSLRETDETGRLGGDEFAFLLLNADRALTLQVTERILRQIEDIEMETADGDPISITTSVGISLFPGDGRKADDLLRKADEALYRAKRRGRNQLAFFQDSDAPREAGRSPEAVREVGEG